MSRSEKVTLTNMCMVYDDKGNILIQDRKDISWPGVCFPGGHIEVKESFVESVIREVKEETGLTITNPVLCGVKQFTTKEHGRYIVFFYKTNTYTGELCSSDEGEVYWIKRSELHNYQLSEDFEDMLKVFESDELSEFYYYNEEGDWDYKLL